MFKHVLAFGHRARNGKDYCANHAASCFREFYPDHTITVISFASKLKADVYDLYKGKGIKDEQYYEKHPEEKDIVLPRLEKTPRQIWVDYGTKGIRNCVYGYTWVDYVFEKYDVNMSGKNILLISDLRFPNEFDRVKEYQGLCVKVVRTNYPERKDEADVALTDETRWDHIIEAKSGELLSLQRQVETIVGKLVRGHK